MSVIIRRNFNKKEKIALYLIQNGKCAACGRELKSGWHGDHIKPFVRGGATDIINAQALCAECNMRKGGKNGSI